MFCRMCGTEFQGRSRCPNCGTPVSQVLEQKQQVQNVFLDADYPIQGQQVNNEQHVYASDIYSDSGYNQYCPQVPNSQAGPNTGYDPNGIYFGNNLARNEGEVIPQEEEFQRPPKDKDNTKKVIIICVSVIVIAIMAFAAVIVVNNYSDLLSNITGIFNREDEDEETEDEETEDEETEDEETEDEDAEEELAQVTGGVSKEAIFKVIDTCYAWVPGSIRTAIKNAYTTLGSKAARKLGEKLLEGYPGAVKMLDMFSD